MTANKCWKRGWSRGSGNDRRLDSNLSICRLLDPRPQLSIECFRIHFLFSFLFCSFVPFFFSFTLCTTDSFFSVIFFCAIPVSFQVTVILRPLFYTKPPNRPVLLVLSSQHAVRWWLEAEGLPLDFSVMAQVCLSIWFQIPLVASMQHFKGFSKKKKNNTVSD